MKNTTRTNLAVLGLNLGLMLGVALGSNAALAEGSLNVINWEGYVAEDTISNFEKEFGIDVTYDSYDSIESIDAKLLAGSSGYDVVLHAGSHVARLIPADILMAVDKSELPNLENMMPSIMTQLEDWDPDNKFAVPFMWGTTGVTYNPDLLNATLPNAPIGSLDLIFDPENMEKLAECGVSYLDSPTEMIPMALAYMGLDPNSTNPDDYTRVAELLSKVRPFVKTFDNYAYTRMPQKEFCISVTYGPDGLIAMSSAEEANTDVAIDFFMPPNQGGSVLWVDAWVIPSDAKNVENAHLFLNYMMRPEVAAADSNYTWYANANEAAYPLVDAAVTSNQAAYPTPEQISMMYTLTPVPQNISRLRTRVWTNFKAGN